MIKYFSCLLITVYCLLVFSCGNNSEKNSEVKLAGQTLYESSCTGCHGGDGKLCALGAKDLSVSTMTNDQMMDIITNGKSTMTPFGNVLTKEEIASLAGYVQTLKSK